jgi:serine/threonine protein kinase
MVHYADRQFNEAGHELMRSLLARDPQARPTASQVLTHRFFAAGDQPEDK